jgi:hypothetical protein
MAEMLLHGSTLIAGEGLSFIHDPEALRLRAGAGDTHGAAERERSFGG